MQQRASFDVSVLTVVSCDVWLSPQPLIEMARPPLVPLVSPEERRVCWFSHCQYPVLDRRQR